MNEDDAVVETLKAVLRDAFSDVTARQAVELSGCRTWDTPEIEQWLQDCVRAEAIAFRPCRAGRAQASARVRCWPA